MNHVIGSMRIWTLALALGRVAAPVHAQDFGALIQGGAVIAGAPGVAGTIVGTLEHRGFLARAGGPAVGTGKSADWEESTRAVASTLGVGLIGRSTTGPRPYGLIVAGSGLDWRENDHFRSVGAVCGIENLRGRLSGEVRYERWIQHGPLHVRLPKHAVGAHLGLRLF